MKATGTVDSYVSVTELTGSQVTRDQLERMKTRYRFAASLCAGRDVLEVACGSGQGLGILASTAKSVRGGDVDATIVSVARAHYGDRIPVQVIDAHSLPFSDKSFGAVVLFEAIYYLRDPRLFVAEARRVLCDGGVLVLGSANKDWSGFNPSPFSLNYFGAPDLKKLLSEAGFQVELFAASPSREDGLLGRLKSLLKISAVRFGLIPKTMNGKKLLKRIFFGRLEPLPPELTDESEKHVPPMPISGDQPHKAHKVLFAVGRLKI